LIALAVVICYLIALAVATGTAKGSPARMVDRSSAVLVWLERHPRPGTPRSRARVRRYHLNRVTAGLRAAGVLEAFLCIHRHEGAWNAHNYPYGGGLQEDEGFQRTYGGEYRTLWGSAGYWPPWAQLVAAYRAHHGYHGYAARGFTPWPNTARMCGLL